MTIMSENKLCAVTKKASNEVAASSSTERKKDANNEEQENLSRVESEEDEDEYSSESDSSSTSGEEKAPIELMGEFLLYVRQGSWENAKKLCRMILIYEPDNPEALQFLPMIEEKIQILKELAEEVSSDSSSSEEEESEEDSDENDDDDDEDDSESTDDDKTEHLKNKLIFPHKDNQSMNIWKP